MALIVANSADTDKKPNLIWLYTGPPDKFTYLKLFEIIFLISRPKHMWVLKTALHETPNRHMFKLMDKKIVIIFSLKSFANLNIC